MGIHVLDEGIEKILDDLIIGLIHELVIRTCSVLRFPVFEFVNDHCENSKRTRNDPICPVAIGLFPALV